jgi:hypothetical protein
MRKCLIAGMLAAVALPGSALAACPFSYVFNYVSSPQVISVVTGSAGAGTTTFQTSTTGSVSRISGPGSLAASASGRQITVQMAMSNCSNVNNVANFSGCSDTPTVTVAAYGTPTGLNQALTAFTVVYTGAAGSSIASTSGSAPLTIHLSPSGVTYYAPWSFDLGYNLPISDSGGGGSAGNGSSMATVTVTPSTPGCAGATSTVVVPALVNTPLTITSTSSLSFGRIVRSASGGTVTYTPTSSGGGSIAVTGGVIALPSPAPTLASFRISGQQFKEVNVQLSSSVNLTHGSDTIVLTPLAVWGSDASNGGFNNGANGAGQANLGNADGVATIYVGGSFALTPSTPSGFYSGVISLTATYQ